MSTNLQIENVKRQRVQALASDKTMQNVLVFSQETAGVPLDTRMAKFGYAFKYLEFLHRWADQTGFELPKMESAS